MKTLLHHIHITLFTTLLISSLSNLKTCSSNNNNNNINIQLNDDILGLMVFKSDLNDPSSSLSSWNEDDINPCSWQYIKCNQQGRVSQLSLSGLALSGKIGRGLEKLQHLQVLQLSHNNLSGAISPSLTLSNTLQSLNLSHNSISGQLPDSFIDMSSMRFLDLSYNSFAGQVFDGFFENCSLLRRVSFAMNLFEGQIPSTISKCSLVNNVDFSNNHFSGNVDFSRIWSLTRLRNLDLSNNDLSGNLVDGVSNLHNLKELLLQNNHFSGELPKDIGLCIHLDRIDFGNNQLSGELPESLGRLSYLRYFRVSDNHLLGEFPQWIGNLISLEHLDLSNNQFYGSIPLSLVSCMKLSKIFLRGNGFNGTIPEGLFGLGLEEIDFSRNGLIGSVPAGSNRLLETLTMLDLSVNQLKGNVPAEIGLLSKLRYLNFSWNDLDSAIPPEFGLLQNLEVLDLRNCALFGLIPEDICDSGNLDVLQLDGNSLKGPIPEDIGNCSSLYLLSLSFNNLTGPIPKSMSNLNKLKILNLEFNELNGELPMELGKLQNLLAVNVSHNSLTGRLPVGSIFQNLDKSSLEGNYGLCSPLLKGPCIMNVSKPLVLDPHGFDNQMNPRTPRNESSESSGSIHHHRFLSVSAIIAIAASFVIVLGVIAISLLNASVRRKLAFVENSLESMCSSSSKSGAPATGKLILFDSQSSQDWISNPENLLSKASEIGEGVFGTVYKIPLGSQQGRNVAIKRLVTSNIIQFPEDFDREVRILGKARHPNLIALKGYYWTPQLQLLVSEFAPNGNLQSKLHEKLPSSPSLSWPNRFKILLGTAKGLSHLHHSFRPPIIHYNIKPSNILLDENFNAKISDFGLARLLTKLDKHVMSNRFQSALGYVAPELACQSLRVNEKCDVYGFGVMILELVTGRRPVEYGEDNVLILNDHVRVLLEHGNVLECVDPSLMNEYPEDEVLPVLKLAMVCTSQIPSSRPTMAEVVQILQVIKTPVPQRMEVF
ncbi:probably inactive leucine-rich repeat receptor-like protein kinase At3g28040 [Vicia villosa]|uniref:probably inactive leucine-rich repeat receptor-like protein kinase At3g28040 n=1 Tax=Vicia villosa TaxID=3911 RepID=UPI00273ABA5D|nr:probably inactive leucine-rich repeat receptor-like protein kinase At3g28040 [Vicia villosa]